MIINKNELNAKNELRLPKQQLELALVNIGPFWHPNGNSFELTRGPLAPPWNPEQMQLVFTRLLPVAQSLELRQGIGVDPLCNRGTTMHFKGAVAFGLVA